MDVVSSAIIFLLGMGAGFIAGRGLTKWPTIEVMQQRVVDAKVEAQLREIAKRSLMEEVARKVSAQQMNEHFGQPETKIPSQSGQGYYPLPQAQVSSGALQQTLQNPNPYLGNAAPKSP